MAITQSAMSNAPNRRRQYFDDPLLVKVGRRMVLTPRAEGLVDPLRDLLVRIGAAVATPPGFDPGTSSRTVALMVSDYALHTLIPPFVRRIARLAPGFEIELKPQQTYPGFMRPMQNRPSPVGHGRGVARCGDPLFPRRPARPRARHRMRSRDPALDRLRARLAAAVPGIEPGIH